jgi:sodium-dependent dicarboxylate transporter 2/3/5
MSLPISTPPNAIAFSTGTVETKEMAKAGTLVSLIGIIVLMSLAVLLLNVESLR